MSSAEMKPPAAAAATAEESEGIHKRNKQGEYCASPSRSCPEDCSEAKGSVSVLLELEISRDYGDVDISGGNPSVVAVIPSRKTVRETDPRPRYGASSVCGRRRDMEDAVAIHPSFVRKQTEFSRTRWHYFGVYDGHGCSHVRRRFTTFVFIFKFKI